MAKTKQDFIAEGRASYNHPLRVRGDITDTTMPEFGLGDSWQARAFAEGWRIEYHLDRDRQEQEARKLGEQINREPVEKQHTGYKLGGGRIVMDGKDIGTVSSVYVRPRNTASDERRAARIDAMTRGYLTAMQWAETDESGDPLDTYELADDTRTRAWAVCESFYDQHHVDLGAYVAHPGAQNRDCADPYELAGHDLWLTSKGHGVGFWDRGMGGIGKRLSAACGYHTNFPPRDAYVGDDGLVYLDN